VSVTIYPTVHAIVGFNYFGSIFFLGFDRNCYGVGFYQPYFEMV